MGFHFYEYGFQYGVDVHKCRGNGLPHRDQDTTTATSGSDVTRTASVPAIDREAVKTEFRGERGRFEPCFPKYEYIGCVRELRDV